MQRRYGLTLVELMGVVAIVAILVAFLLPAIQVARESARRSHCANNLQRLALACHVYHDRLGWLPPGAQWDPDVRGAAFTSDDFRPNWIVLLLPFLKEQRTFDAFDLSEFLSHERNRAARSTSIATLLCPVDLTESQRTRFRPAPDRSGEGPDWARNNYGCNGDLHSLRGASGVMGVNCSRRLVDILDGTSNTLLLAELRVGLSPHDRRGTWAMGVPGASMLTKHGRNGDANGPNPCNEDSDDIEECWPNDDAGKALRTRECMTCSVLNRSDQAAPRGRHPYGIMVAAADASVHFVNNAIDTGGPWSPTPSVWDRFCSPNDGNGLDTTQVFAE